MARPDPATEVAHSVGVARRAERDHRTLTRDGAVAPSLLAQCRPDDGKVITSGLSVEWG
jgi:hypothetical protein